MKNHPDYFFFREATIRMCGSLDIEKAVQIHEYCKGKIKDAYGIGTNLTNDVGATPLNIVIKLSGCKSDPDSDWQNTVKLSDDKGKHTGDKEELKRCLNELGMD